MKVWNKGKGLNDVDWASTEFCYTPIIQSQTTSTGFDLSPAAESSSDDIAHKGVFLMSLGMRYKGYCANVGRSIIVDPSKVCFEFGGSGLQCSLPSRNKKTPMRSFFPYSPRC